MKILIGVHHFLPRYTGGAEGQAYRLAKGLIAKGHQVQVVCVERIDQGTQPGVTWVDELYDEIPVRRLSYNNRLFPDPARWEYDNLWIGDHLSQWMADMRPDLFHLVGGYLLSGRSLLAAQELSIPTVVSVMDFWFLCPRISMLRSDGTLSGMPIDPARCAECLAETQRRFRWPAKIAPGLMRRYWETQTPQIYKIEARAAFLKQTLDQADRIISNSQFLMSMLAQGGMSPDRMIYLRQGRDFSSPQEQAHPKTASALRVGYIGQIAELKGVHVLLQAVRTLSDVPLQVKVYGDLSPFPRYANRLRKLAAGDRRIELAGVFHGAEEETQILSEMDVLVVPSTWYENSPNVILEAFAHHVPVLASGLGGMAELVQNNVNGLLFKTGDPADLARQLKRLIDEPDLLSALRKGIPTVRSVDAEIEQTVSIYREIVEKQALRMQEL